MADHPAHEAHHAQEAHHYGAMPNFEQQFATMSIAQATAVVDTLPDNTAEKLQAIEILKNRKNPLQYLSKFFFDPRKLLELMRVTGTILSGSRATEYFTPNSCTSESDLDFYCRAGVRVVVMYGLGEMGVQWVDEHNPQAASVAADYTVSGFSVHRGFLAYRRERYEIQLICGKGNCNASACIFDFHSTVTQAFLSGFAAVSLYDDYTSNREAIYWPGNDTNTVRAQPHRIYVQRQRPLLRYGEQYRAALDAREPADWADRDWEPAVKAPEPSMNQDKIIRKFTRRGYRFVDYHSTHGSGSGVGVYGGRYRTVGDDGVRRVSFEPYIDTTGWDIPFHCYYNAMGYISWYETGHKTTAVPSVLETIDFPYSRETSVPGDQEWSGANQLFDP